MASSMAIRVLVDERGEISPMICGAEIVLP
jgi:hypothetical protein